MFPETIRPNIESRLAIGSHNANQDNEAMHVEQSQPSFAQSVLATGETVKAKVATVDHYAIQPRPPSQLGGFITIIAWLCVLAYTIWTVYVWITRPWMTTSETVWTYSAGPWPLLFRCRAMSGCYISNRIQAKWAPNAPQDSATQAVQSACTFLSPGDYFELQTSFSNSPNDGVSFLYIPGPSAGMTLPATSAPVSIVPNGFGAEIESYIVCGPGTNATLLGVPCIDGSLQLLSPIQSGVTLLFLVETSNASASGRGIFRREWYPTQVSTDGAIIQAATTCNVSSLSLNSSWVQGRVRLTAQWATVQVHRDSLWLVVWGAVGGAMALFFQVGGIVLGLVGIAMQLKYNIHLRRGRV